MDSVNRNRLHEAEDRAAVAEQPTFSSWGSAALNFLGFSGANGKEYHQTQESSPNHSPHLQELPLKSKARLDGSIGYQDDVLHKLSRINGAINRMTKEDIKAKLVELHLNPNGSIDVVKKRLKNHYKSLRLAQCNRPLKEDEKMKFPYLVVIDYEATCSETNENFVHEIIEFPAVLVDTENKIVCNVFQRFCKPRINPVLTKFCTSLTGISQSQVDKSQDFTEVFKEFEEWLALHKLGSAHKFAIVTDGPWDMARFLKTQTELSNIPFPKWARQWINLRKAYSAFYGSGKVNLQHMLDDLGMEFQGRPHCGLDDTRNIAAIAIRMLQDGCIMRINEYFHQKGTSPQQANGQAHGSGSHTSSPKSRLTQSKQGRQQQCREEVPQEGENMQDLLEYMRLQKL